MRESWQRMIAQIEKYFHIVPNENGWNFIISPKKEWAFDILNRIWVNSDGHGNWYDDMHPVLKKGTNRQYGYVDFESGKQYIITTHKYLNGNTLVHIRIENY